MSARELLAGALVALTVTATVPAFDRVFTSAVWRAPAVTATLLALVLVALMRATRRGMLLGAIISLVAFLATTPWLLGLAPAPVLPTPAVVAELTELLRQGLDDLAVTPAPAEPVASLLLLVVAGFWWITHIAAEAVLRIRRPGAALVATGVLWVAPLAVPMAREPQLLTVVPLLACAALLLLVVRDEDDEVTAETPTVPVTGVALAALAILVATTAPGLLPGYGAPGWVGLGASATPRGYQPIVDISTRLRLPEERDVLRVQASQRTYLRLAGLDTFDGATWRLGPAGEGAYRPDPANLFSATDVLPPEVPAERTELVYVDVEVLALENIYVPVPYQPVEVLGPQRADMVWSTDGGFLATWDTVDDGLGAGPTVGLREGAAYRVQAARPTPDYADLVDVRWSEATLERYTQLPRDYTELGELAEEVYAAADATTPVDRALALQEWFTGPGGGFTYDLDVPALRGDRALTDFVVEDRVGYCEYFATAMAVMLRQTGIPARVAVGFLPGRVSRVAAPAEGRDLTEYTVSTADAHAWVEVLFPGAGWITFEPTPRDDDTQIVPSEQDLAPIENLRERRARELRERAEGLDDDPVQDSPDIDQPDAPDPSAPPTGADAAGGRDGTAAGQPVPPVWLLVLAVAAVGMLAVLAVRRRRHGPDHRLPPARDRVLAAQRHVLAVAAAHGVGRRREETVREVVHRWAVEGRGVVADPDVLRSLEAAAFGGVVDADAADRVEAWADTTVEALRASVGRRDRVLSPVRVPATAAVAGLRRGGTAVRDRVESLTAPPGDDRR